MYTKVKSVLKDYFLPQKLPNDFYYMNEYGMYSYYNHTETDILNDELDISYVQPFPKKP
jgi:hypothetical protein